MKQDTLIYPINMPLLFIEIKLKIKDPRKPSDYQVMNRNLIMIVIFFVVFFFVKKKLEISKIAWVNIL